METTPPSISIIIPVYNVEKYVRECIDSTLKLNAPSYEVILIDDGSKDRSGAICDEFAQKYVNVKVIHQDNKGVSVARNKGLEKAHGEWVWFVDADDVINTKVDFAKVLEKVTDSDYVMFDIARFDDGSTIPTITNGTINYVTKCTKDDFLNEYVCDCHQMLWYKRSVIEQFKIRFPEGIKITEDLEFQFKYLMHSEYPVKVDAVNYFYRQRDGSSIHRSDSQAISNANGIQVMLNILKHMKAYGVELKPWLSFRIEKYLAYGSLYAAANDAKLRDRTRQAYHNAVSAYREAGYQFPSKKTLQLAYSCFDIYMPLFLLSDRIKRLIGLRK